MGLLGFGDLGFSVRLAAAERTPKVYKCWIPRLLPLFTPLFGGAVCTTAHPFRHMGQRTLIPDFSASPHSWPRSPVATARLIKNRLPEDLKSPTWPAPQTACSLLISPTTAALFTAPVPSLLITSMTAALFTAPVPSLLITSMTAALFTAPDPSLLITSMTNNNNDILYAYKSKHTGCTNKQPPH